ncbi:major histocompatibility complex class I-related gene protein-like [Aquarana catesbeiana]|uniref:major histocompatibility complex class I-related gene protein-like n=1 Tax=Aquarana catesbeiana TaxID=8400 RepID=UPI003CC9F71F
MEPGVCFEPSIDFNTLKHLVTDVPDPPESYFLQLIGSPRQLNNSINSRTLKHLVTDVPDPPEESVSTCIIYEHLLHFGTRLLSIHQKTENKKTTSPWNKRGIVFLCLSLFLPITFCDDHMLSYYHTGLYYPEEGRYRFETIGYVDDQEIDMYSSESHVNIPKTSWMEENEDDDYWERQTSMRKGWEKVFRDNLMILASRFNYTRTSHTLQLSYGCQMYNEDIRSGYYRYGFDGKDFLIFDVNTLLWTPGMQKAEISAQRWNSDSDIGKDVKFYLTEHCISALKKYICYGREELEKRVVPKLKITSQEFNGTARLQCLVYGFHPRPVDVKWVRNGEDHLPSDEMSPILPHPDGTYQIRVSVEVPTKEADTYSCHVDHSSLEETLTVKWVPDYIGILNEGSIVGIALAGGVLLLILVACTGVLALKKKPAKYYSAVFANLL